MTHSVPNRPPYTDREGNLIPPKPKTLPPPPPPKISVDYELRRLRLEYQKLGRLYREQKILLDKYSETIYELKNLIRCHSYPDPTTQVLDINLDNLVKITKLLLDKKPEMLFVWESEKLEEMLNRCKAIETKVNKLEKTQRGDNYQ